MNQKDALLLSITTFITIVAWIGFNIYHATVTSTIPESLQKKVQPIEGKFDTEVIESVKKRQKVQPVSVPPAATESAILTTPKATTSAQEKEEEEEEVGLEL